MGKYTLSSVAIILMVFSIGLTSNSAAAAEDLNIEETIELPNSQELFGDKSPVSPFRDFVVGPDRSFFVTLNAQDNPVTKFTSSGQQAEIKAVAEGTSNQLISPVSRGITLSSDQNVVIAGSREPYEFTPQGDLIDQYSLDGSKPELRLVDVAADSRGNIYVANMNDQIKKIKPDGSVDTWQIDKNVFDSEIPNFSTPVITATPEYLFALMGQTDKLLKYNLDGEMVETIDLPDKEFGGSTKARTIVDIEGVKSGKLVALQDDLDNRVHVLSNNGDINHSYEIPQSLAQTGRMSLQDITIGPDGNIHALSTSINSSSNSNQTSFITSADIGLDRQYNQTDKQSSNAKSSESSSQDESGDSNDTDTQGYWKTGATSSPSDQSEAEISTLMKLSNALQQLKVLVGMQ